jgi:hypothetical protein
MHIKNNKNLKQEEEKSTEKHKEDKHIKSKFNIADTDMSEERIKDIIEENSQDTQIQELTDNTKKITSRI